jgi:hypothetical protein
MPHRLTLVLLLAALVLAGCDDDDAVEPPPAPAETKGVVLSLDRTTPHAGETLELTVENHTRERLEYGLAYKLERRNDGRWVWINEDAAFALILKVVGPGRSEREDILLPDDLRPDRYRIVKSFTAPATGRELDASVEFTVASR